MARRTRSRVASETWSGRLSTLLTVPSDSPARRATSLMLTAMACPSRDDASIIAAAGHSARPRPGASAMHPYRIARIGGPPVPFEFDLAQRLVPGAWSPDGADQAIAADVLPDWRHARYLVARTHPPAHCSPSGDPAWRPA